MESRSSKRARRIVNLSRADVFRIATGGYSWTDSRGRILVLLQRPGDRLPRRRGETGLRQVRFGNHETRGPGLHGHFEAHDRPLGKGGRVIENTRVDIVP